MAVSFRKHDEASTLQTVLAWVVGLIYFAPVGWILLTSLKTRADALAIPPKLIFKPTLENFRAVFVSSSASGEVTGTGVWVYFAGS